MIKAVEEFAPDCIIHLGDCVRDAERLHGEYPQLRLYSVAGNCDYCPASPDQLLVEEGGVRIFMAHGHRHNVKMGLSGFINSAGFSGAQIGLFGHTHTPLCMAEHGLVLMNPGSVGRGTPSTYGQIFIDNGSFDCKIAVILYMHHPL